MKALQKLRQLVRGTLDPVVRLPMSEHEMVKLLQKHGVAVALGAQYSIRCQFGQIAEVIRDVERSRCAGVPWRPLCGLQGKYRCHHKMINGECEVRECQHQIQSNIAGQPETSPARR